MVKLNWFQPFAIRERVGRTLAGWTIVFAKLYHDVISLNLIPRGFFDTFSVKLWIRRYRINHPKSYRLGKYKAHILKVQWSWHQQQTPSNCAPYNLHHFALVFIQSLISNKSSCRLHKMLKITFFKGLLTLSRFEIASFRFWKFLKQCLVFRRKYVPLCLRYFVYLLWIFLKIFLNIIIALTWFAHEKLIFFDFMGYINLNTKILNKGEAMVKWYCQYSGIKQNYYRNCYTIIELGSLEYLQI